MYRLFNNGEWKVIMNRRLYPKHQLILSVLLLCTTGSVIVASDTRSESTYESQIALRVLDLIVKHSMLAWQEISVENPLRPHAMLIALSHVRGLNQTFNSLLADSISRKLFGESLPPMWPIFDRITLLDGKYTPNPAIRTSSPFQDAKKQTEYKIFQKKALELADSATKYINKAICHAVIQKIVHNITKRYLLAKLIPYLGPEWEALAKFDSLDVATDLLPHSLRKITTKIRSTSAFIDMLENIGQKVIIPIKVLILLKIQHEIHQFKQSIQSNQSTTNSEITINVKNDFPTLYWYSKIKNYLPDGF